MAYCAYCGSHVAQVSNLPCPSCGKPSNGAPPPPAGAGGGSKVLVIILAVVIGGFVLLAVIGILAAIAVPNLLTAMQRSRQKRTMADMRTIAVRVEAYRADKGKWPEGHAVSEIASEIGEVPTADGWGTLYAYEALPEGYVLASGGADKTFERGSLAEYEKVPDTTNFDCDIVFANGEFVQYPGGN